MIAERPVAIETADAVRLEGRLAHPAGAPAGIVICHPHPLYGGDMDSPVVERIATACAAAGLATLRFNFRGVGQSTGRHGGGVAEEQDVIAALDHVRGLVPAAGLAGYSFGAAVAARVAAGRAGAVCLVAPPLGPGDDVLAPALGALGTSLLLVAGDRDPYCPPAAVARVREAWPAATITLLEGADHFFFSALEPLAEAITAWARRTLGSDPGQPGRRRRPG